MKIIDRKHHLCGDCQHFMVDCGQDLSDTTFITKVMSMPNGRDELYQAILTCPNFIPDTDCKNCPYINRKCSIPYGRDCSTYSTLLEGQIRARHKGEERRKNERTK